MSQSDGKKLNPSTLSLLLVIILIIFIGAFIAITVFFQSQLKALSIDVKNANNAATVSRTDLAGLKELKGYIEKEKNTIEKTKKILADSQSYQEQILSDIEKYSSRSGITVTGVSFEAVESKGATNGVSPNQAPTSGLKFATATINIKNPVPFTNVMQFIYFLEQNLTKIQLNGISMTKTSKSGQDITVSPLSIRIYLR